MGPRLKVARRQKLFRWGVMVITIVIILVCFVVVSFTGAVPVVVINRYCPLWAHHLLSLLYPPIQEYKLIPHSLWISHWRWRSRLIIIVSHVGEHSPWPDGCVLDVWNLLVSTWRNRRQHQPAFPGCIYFGAPIGRVVVYSHSESLSILWVLVRWHRGSVLLEPQTKALLRIN